MSRITGGFGKGRHLVNAPKSRPTSSRAREALFSILTADIPGAIFCDAFAGGGSVGIEALSRGAASVLFIEISHHAITTIHENLSRTGFTHIERDHWRDAEQHNAITMQGDLYKLSKRPAPTGPVDLWFLDPPWTTLQLPVLLGAIEESPWLATGGIAILEHPTRMSPTDPDGFQLIDRRKYGDTSFSMWQKG